MRSSLFFILAMSVATASLLLADTSEKSEGAYASGAAHLKKNEKNLAQMKADLQLDDDHARQGQADMRQGTADMSDHVEQRSRDIAQLQSVETQVAAAQKQKILARQSYKEAVHQFGSDDPRSAAARENWEKRQLAMDSLLRSRQTLKDDVHRGGRQVHNDKVLLSIQQRSLDSNVAYGAADHRRIQKVEQNISDDRRMMTQHVTLAEPLGSK